MNVEAEKVKIPAPKTEEEIIAARAGLDSLLERFDSKNDMARTLGVARNTVSWWFTKGFVPSDSAFKVSELLSISVEEIRPDYSA